MARTLDEVRKELHDVQLELGCEDLAWSIAKDRASSLLCEAAEIVGLDDIAGMYEAIVNYG